jgi:cytochrome b
MSEPTVPIRVWDLPTRLFHWVLAGCVVGSIVTAKIGGNAMVWHFRLGYVVLGLLAFRLVWGLLGGRWSRFSSFVYAPATLMRYLRGRREPADTLDVGHSPVGALSVFALLGLLSFQVGTGLFAWDENFEMGGPLNRFIGSGLATTLTGWHEEVGESVLLGLVLLHVAAIGFYRLVKRRDLVRPMILGDKALPAQTPASADGWPQRLLALALAAACAAAVGWVVSLGG